VMRRKNPLFEYPGGLLSGKGIVMVAYRFISIKLAPGQGNNRIISLTY